MKTLDEFPNPSESLIIAKLLDFASDGLIEEDPSTFTTITSYLK
jgi:hypothetical protein